MQEIIDLLALAGDKLSTMAKSDIVVGTSFELEGNTIVPISKIGVGIGCGAGSGSGQLSEQEARKHPQLKNAQGRGVGGGAGGGVSVKPVAVVVIGPDGVQILPVEDKPGAFARLLDSLPDLVAKIKDSVEGKEQRA